MIQQLQLRVEISNYYRHDQYTLECSQASSSAAGGEQTSIPAYESSCLAKCGPLHVSVQCCMIFTQTA